MLHLLRDSLRQRQDPAVQTKVQAGLRPGDAPLLHSSEEARLRGELDLVLVLYFHTFLILFKYAKCVSFHFCVKLTEEFLKVKRKSNNVPQLPEQTMIMVLYLASSEYSRRGLSVEE